MATTLKKRMATKKMGRNRSDSASKILSDLRESIINGDFKPNECLPSENDLANHYKVTRFFARKAFTELEKQGLITNQPGVGRFVCDNRPNNVERLALITSEKIPFFERDDELLLPMHAFGWQKSTLKCCTDLNIIPLYINRPSDNVRDVLFLIDQAVRSDIDAIVGKLDMEGEDIATVLNALQATKLPFLLFRDLREEDDINFIAGNEYKVAKMQTTYLIEQGHEHIALLYIGKQQNFSYYRFRGYADALKEHGLPVDRRLAVEAPFAIELDRFERDWEDTGYRAAKNFLQLNRNDVTAIVSISDEFSNGIIEAFKEAGKTIPDDYSLISFDNAPRYKHLNLTTGFFPSQENVVDIIKHFIDNINNGSKDVIQAYLEPQLIIGNSVIKQD